MERIDQRGIELKHRFATSDHHQAAIRPAAAGGGEHRLEFAHPRELFPAMRRVRGHHMAKAALDELREAKPKRHFTVGIVDDITKLHAMSPFGRVCQPDDVADVVHERREAAGRGGRGGARASRHRRAAAATITWMLMISGIIVTSIVVGAQLNPYSHERLIAVTAATGVVAFCIGLLGVAGMEKKPSVDRQEERAASTSFRESLQDVPAAVTAFDSQAISNAGIERPADFIALTPNVTLVETQNAGNAFVIIRGITQNRNSEPSVAVIVDGVQQVNPAQFNQDLFDIEQIEVLKGPQGGLYGRNAIGGAIIITTKKPTDEFSGNITAGVDNGFGYYVRGGVSGPLAEGVKLRVAGSWYDTDGFINNAFLNEKADPVEDFSLRGNLLIEATDKLTFDLRASVNQLRTQGLYYNIVADVNDIAPVEVNNRGQNDRDIYNMSLKVEYAGDNAVLTSISSYDTVKEVLTGDAFDFKPIPDSFFFNLFEAIIGPGQGFDLNQSQYLNVKAFSQEVRLASPEDGRAFNWMAGGYLIDTTRFISTGNMIDTNNGVFPVFRSPSTNPLNPLSRCSKQRALRTCCGWGFISTPN